MINQAEKDIILQCAKKYRVSCVCLFGSCHEKNEEANDIDLGVKGIEAKLFFKFYAELVKHLPKPVDLEDGNKKQIDFKKYLYGKVFAPLNDIKRFKNFRIDKELGTIVWDTGADFCPDFLYSHTKNLINKTANIR